MKRLLSRALMAIATGCMGESRRLWSAAMEAEFEAAAEEGEALPFAAGCLVAASREMLRREEGHLILSSYALAVGLMIPIAVFQLGCALLGWPYLYPEGGGALVVSLRGEAGSALLHSVNRGGIPSFTLLLLVLGAGHLRLAWVMLERDWDRVTRMAAAMVAAVVTLALVMSAFFIDSSRVLFQGGVIAIELVTVAMVARWHAQLFPAVAEAPG